MTGGTRALACALLALVVAGCAAGVSTTATTATDARSFDRGRALYENNCRVCHTSKVHRRIPALPTNEAELRQIVLVWVRFEGMKWSNEDVDDVVHYVNRTYYQFDK
jgi:mono/diheme cytochrome c family protein